MSNVNEIIERLENLAKHAVHCVGEPRFVMNLDDGIALHEAIDLLKAQEPILLENQHKPGGHVINANSPWISRCPKCGKKIEGKQTRFCKYCGRAVKWE